VFFKTIALKTLASVSAASLMAVASASAQNPYAQPDGDWISITGEVASVGEGAFMLDYGEGVVTVEMDDWDWYDEASRLVSGEQVTVYGAIDDDLFEVTSIEANSVYVFDRNTYFYANDADEEDAYYVAYPFPVTVADGGWVSVSGSVKSINGREFIVDTGLYEIQVDTDTLAYNPLDDFGYQQIDQGDVVTVSGELDEGFFERREILASSITTGVRDETRKFTQ